jgi:hypothetical protein
MGGGRRCASEDKDQGPHGGRHGPPGDRGAGRGRRTPNRCDGDGGGDDGRNSGRDQGRSRGHGVSTSCVGDRRPAAALTLVTQVVTSRVRRRGGTGSLTVGEQPPGSDEGSDREDPGDLGDVQDLVGTWPLYRINEPPIFQLEVVEDGRHGGRLQHHRTLVRAADALVAVRRTGRTGTAAATRAQPVEVKIGFLRLGAPGAGLGRVTSTAVARPAIGHHRLGQQARDDQGAQEPRHV